MQPHRRQAIRLRRPWDFPGKSTGVGCNCLLRKSQEDLTNKQQQQQHLNLFAHNWSLIRCLTDRSLTLGLGRFAVKDRCIAP